jgi:hypothetical protein
MAQLEAKAQAERAAAQARRDEVAGVNARRALERLTPLEDRLARLLNSIPPDVRAAGLPLSSLRASLKGRWRGNAHPGEVGRALRKLNYERRRNWSGGPNGYSALWFPKG